MSKVTLSNVDEVLRALRAERNELERKDQAREEEYKRATKLYVKALQKENEALERKRPNYDKRNESFIQEVQDILGRFKVGAFGLLKSGDRLEKEIDKFNSYLLDHYPKLASEVKEKLQKEKHNLESKLLIAKENNEKNKIPISQAQEEMPALSILEIREKRRQLEKDLKPSLPPQYKHPKGLQATPLENYFAGRTVRQRSSSLSRSYLDEFVAPTNVLASQNDISNNDISQRLSYKPVLSEPALEFTSSVGARSHTAAPYTFVKDNRVQHGRSKSTMRTNILSDFEIKEPKAVTSPEKIPGTVTGRSPTKTESLFQYSPDSRISSAIRSQNY